MVKRHCSKCDPNEDQTIGSVQKVKKCQKCGTLLLQHCRKCDQQFSSYDAIKYHLKTKCYAGLHFHCTKCFYTCRTTVEIFKHFKNTHDMQCSECSVYFKSIQSFRRHAKFCGKIPNLKCELCPFKTKYATSLRKHNDRMHLNNYSSF